MRKTDLKDVPPRIKACQQPKRQRLAPGVIDGPYLPRSRKRQFAMDFSVAMALIVVMVLLVDLVVWLHAAGWL